jgi:hypothetical protein
MSITLDREHFLNHLISIKGKRLFPDFPEGPRDLKGFRMLRVGDGYQICTRFGSRPCMLVVTIHSINKEGFIIRLDSISSLYMDYLKSILGKDIIRLKHQYYLEGKEYPLEQGQQYRYDEKTKNYYLHGEEPIVKEIIWNYFAKRKIDKFLKDLQQAQSFYKHFVSKNTILKRMVYEDLHDLYESYLTYGKKALANPKVVTLSIDKRRKSAIYRDLGALIITERRVNP